MVLFLMIGAVLIVLLSIYINWRFRRIVQSYGGDWSKIRYRVFTATLILLAALLVINVWSTGALITLHVLGISMVCDLVASFIRRRSRGRETGTWYQVMRTVYRCFVIPILLTAGILGYGFYNMNHFRETDYMIRTDKIEQEYRVALITDTHYGTIQDKTLLKKAARQISEEDPDLVVLGGDIVEEGTSKKDMEEVFRILGSIENRYGIYYVYGNHDRQPYTASKSFTNEELGETITSNGIEILQDDYKEINEDLILAGRDDAAWGNTSGRKAVQEVLQGADRDRYIIMADHQPIEAEENAEQGVDLELSGHTHAGQIWPVGLISELTGVLNYGEYQRDGCTVIVSSGFAGWGYAIRTGEHCEYDMITIQAE